MTVENSRAADPGVRLYQLLAVRWVHCPRCDGPARIADRRLVCLRCSHVEGGPKPGRRRLREVMLEKNRPVCERRSCGAPIPNHGPPVRSGAADTLLARVECPTCGHVGRYPAVPIEPLDVARAQAALRAFRCWPGGAPYLSRRIGAHTLVVHNLAHLDALEQWLGAKLRERGPVAGLTMMARLPRWMKAASARPEVLKALADIREQAYREGLGE
ncbi:MAG TPA: hypothetical protein VEW26_01100 [Allosphingosinicella sp.]|nr:hypothetical protein [Allosphingosinicella sp.]